MNRRKLLQGIAATVAQFVAWRLPIKAAATGLSTRPLIPTGPGLPTRRLRPTDPGWPSASSWEQLKKAVGGNLVPVRSLLGACSSNPQSDLCVDATKNIQNPFYIGDQPGGTQVSGWLDAWTPAPSVYAVEARNANHVAAAVNFVRDHNLRLVVKGGGHSYLGTSNAPDSLLVWTRAMNKVTLHDAFVPRGCKMRPVPAVSAESGAMWIDLYQAVTTEGGRYVQGGGCTSVGSAGLVQSGGFGSFSKGFGTAAASLLEAEVVTADGKIRVVNACTNPDLFWALKGGGGGSWGVVTRVSLRTHELPEFFGWAGGTVKARTDDAFRKLIAHFISFYAANLLNPHWGEQVAVGGDNTLSLSMVCQGLTGEETKQVWQPFFDWVSASPADFSANRLRTGAGKARDWWDVPQNDSMVQDRRQGAPKHHGWWRGDQDQVGAFIHGYDSMWLPAVLLKPEKQSLLANALYLASRHKRVQLHFNKGLAGASAETIAAVKNTATNPAVCEAFCLAIIADGQRPSYPGLSRPAIDLGEARNDARKIDLAAQELRRIAPGAGSYVSESNFFNASWQRAYWGKNYPRLRAVKKKYDPDGLFFVHHGVGSEEWSPDGFSRLG
ncbi:MAG TPA: FAD-binding oxidoreductase [Pyrinomonadaceae bacterium]|nr:FAD-binding oxidoreductase [Pyrinomonadaceae bacterium]